MRGSTIVQVLGPLALPGVEALRQAFLDLATLGPHTRIGARAEQGRWLHDPEWVRAEIENIVMRAPDHVGNGVGQWLSGHRIEGVAVQVAVSDDYLAAAFDHALFDAYVPLQVPLLLLDASARKRFTALPLAGRHPLLAALRHTYLGRPESRRALRTGVAAGQALNAMDRDISVTDSPSPAAPIPAFGGPVSFAYAHYDLATSKRIFSAGAEQKLTGAPMIAVLAAAALEAAGVPVHVRGNLLVDLRRYLPGKTVVMGNFSGVLPLAVAGPTSAPEVLSGFVRNALSSGHPLAKAARRGLRRPRRGTFSPRDELVAPPTRARVSMSSLGVVRDYERLPWAADPGQRQVIQTVGTIDVDTVGWICSRVGGCMHMTASFRSDAFPAERIHRALALMGEDPAGLVGRRR